MISLSRLNEHSGSKVFILICLSFDPYIHDEHHDFQYNITSSQDALELSENSKFIF